MQPDHTLLDELELNLAGRPNSRRFTVLQKLTGLFLDGADSYSNESISVFDDLMSRLIERIERQALVELSNKLAPVERPPRNVIGRLSQDDDIEIAEPVLRQSPVISDRDLIHIARTKSQDHLYAIAQRVQISEPIVDILVDRGDPRVAGEVASNTGAQFSRWGFSRAVERAETDESMALAVANRADLPTDLLGELVRKATAVVQRRLMANSTPQTQRRISQVLRTVSEQVVRANTPAARDGRPLIKRDSAELRARILQSADNKDIGELTDALAMLAGCPSGTIGRLVEAASYEAFVAIGKACGMSWPDVQKFVLALVPEGSETRDLAAALYEMYESLSPVDAQRAIQFMRANAFRNAERMRELIQSAPAFAAAS
jgi:uncharacterized protein (DUF2336 family)